MEKEVKNLKKAEKIQLKITEKVKNVKKRAKNTTKIFKNQEKPSNISKKR